MGDILYQPEPRKTMNGTNSTSSNCGPDNSSRPNAIDLRKENTEFETTKLSTLYIDIMYCTEALSSDSYTH